MRSRLLPLVDCITPNRAELAALTGEAVAGPNEVEIAARILAAAHPHLNIVVTGGDAEQPEDFVLTRSGSTGWVRGQRIVGRATHGTGCAFSSALLCAMISGVGILNAAAEAKRYVEGAIRNAPALGAGNGPMNLLWPLHRR